MGSLMETDVALDVFLESAKEHILKPGRDDYDCGLAKGWYLAAWCLAGMPKDWSWVRFVDRTLKENS